MSLDDIFNWQFAAIVAGVTAAGVVRGFNGGGGANFLSAPVLAYFLGPREAVPIVMLLNAVSTVLIIPGAIRHVQWTVAVPLGLAACVTVPLGAWLLFTVDEEVMRRGIALTAFAFSLLLLSGWRYRGRRGIGLTLAAGGIGGAITGAITLGGPPVLLYLMSGPESPAQNRANFITFSAILLVSALIVFFGAGAITREVLTMTLLLLVPYSLAIVIGGTFFGRTSEAVYRRVTLGAIALVSLVILFV